MLFRSEIDSKDSSIKIDYNEKIKTVLDLKQIVVAQLGFKEDNVNLISLFIKRDGTDFALLSDNEFIKEILTKNSGFTLNYKILSGTESMNSKILKMLQKHAKEHSIDIPEECIQDIYEKTDGNLNMMLATIKYMASKK